MNLCQKCWLSAWSTLQLGWSLFYSECWLTIVDNSTNTHALEVAKITVANYNNSVPKGCLPILSTWFFRSLNAFSLAVSCRFLLPVFPRGAMAKHQIRIQLIWLWELLATNTQRYGVPSRCNVKTLLKLDIYISAGHLCLHILRTKVGVLMVYLHTTDWNPDSSTTDLPDMLIT